MRVRGPPKYVRTRGPILRTIVFGGVYEDPPHFGKLPKKLESKLLKEGYIGDYIRENYRSYKGETRSLDCSSCRVPNLRLRSGS